MAKPTSIAAALASSPDMDMQPLEEIIKSELSYWMQYLKEVRAQDKKSYSEIISNPDASAKCKVQALRHILETLPLRHTALISAYNAGSTDSYELSIQLGALLESLRDESTQIELEGWYENRLLNSKKMKTDILAMDAEVVALEDARFGELKGLLKILEQLKIMKESDLVGKAEVEGLIAAMDSIGLSADGVSTDLRNMSKVEHVVAHGKRSDSSWASTSS